MPFTSERPGLRLPESEDRRRKLTSAQHARIRTLWERGASIHSLARRFEVDRRLIQFSLFPERKKNVGRDWRKYHDRAKVTTAVRRLRRRRHVLFNNGLLLKFNGGTRDT
jgi:hypothetical protein